MEVHQMNEFQSLEREVVEGLRLCQFISIQRPGIKMHSLQLLVLPSFGNLEAWDLFQVVRKGQRDNVLVHSTWRRDIDLEAFRSPVERLKHPPKYQPTFDAESVELSAEELNKTLEPLRTMRIPLFADVSTVSIDGLGYELAVGCVTELARLRWCNRAPEPWAPVQAYVDEMLGMSHTN